MKLTKSQISKIIILLVVMIIFNFIFPIHSNAGFFSGVLTRPICYLIVSVTDAVNYMLNAIFIGPKMFDEFLKGIENSDKDEGILSSIRNGTYSTLMSPDKIFSGDVNLLNANIFKVKNNSRKSI